MDAETRATERPQDHKDELRLWLRLLTCTTMTEGMIRSRLREQFAVTLPRFDLLAQLEKASAPMTMGELSRRMMVSNGNVTGLVERLVGEGLVERTTQPHDRRAAAVRLTEAGLSAFAEIAEAHAEWIAEAFADLSDADIRSLIRLLGRLKVSVGGSIG